MIDDETSEYHLPVTAALSGLRQRILDDTLAKLADWPDSFDQFRIVDELAWSGQAVTLRAYDVHLKRDVVLKLYHGEPGADLCERVMTEGQNLAKVDSPYLARCYGTGDYQGHPYLVLEYIEGVQLEDADVPADEITGLFRDICHGVNDLHQAGLVHGDIKPSNVMVDSAGNARLIDLGSSLNSGTADVHSPATVGYLPPECARRESGINRRRADVFSLGGVLYFMLTGNAPFRADSTSEALESAAANRYAQVQRSTLVDPRLVEICEKCLATDPCDRFASGGETLNEVEEICRTIAGPAQVSQKWVASVAVLLLVGLIGLLARAIPSTSETNPSDTGPTATELPAPYSTAEEIEREADTKFAVLANGTRQDSLRATLAVISGDKVTAFSELKRDARERLRLIADSANNSSVTLSLSAAEETWVGLISFEPATDGRGTVPCEVTDECVHLTPGKDWSMTIEDLTASEGASEYLAIVSASRNWNLQIFVNWLKKRATESERGGVGKKTDYSVEVLEYITEVSSTETNPQPEKDATPTNVKAQRGSDSRGPQQEITRLKSLVAKEQTTNKREESIQSLVELLSQSDKIAEAIRYQEMLRESLAPRFKPGHWKVMQADALLTTLQQIQKLKKQDRQAITSADVDLAAAESAYDARKLPQVVSLAGKAHVIFRRFLGDGNRRTLKARRLHAIGGGMMGKPFEARTRLMQIESAQRSLLGEFHPDVIQTQYDIGGAQGNVGDLESAIAWMRKAIAGCDRSEASGCPQTKIKLAAMNYLTFFLKDSGRLGEALRQAEVAMSIARSIGEKSAPYAFALQQRALVRFAAGGDLDVARQDMTVALQTLRATGIPRGQQLFTEFKMADMLLADQKPAAALTEYERVWKEASQIWSKNHNLTSLQRQIAKAQIALGRLDAAVKSLDVAIDRTKAIGGSNDILSQLYLQRGYIYQKQRVPESAMSAFQEALAISRAALGSQHVQTAECLEAIAELKIEVGKDSPRSALTEALKIRTQYAQNVLSSLSEAEMLRFLDGATRTRDLLLSATCSAPDAANDYAAVWKDQELLTAVQLDRRQLAFSDPEAAELWKQIRSAREKVADRYRMFAKENSDKRASALDAAIERKESLQRELAAINALAGGGQEQLTVEQLRQVLPTNVAVIDFCEVRSLSGKRSYVAFVVRNEQSDLPVARVELGDARPVDELVTRWRQEFLPIDDPRGPSPKGLGRKSQPDDDSKPSATASRLKMKLLAPLKRHLSGCDTAVFCPEGPLVRVPWAALPGERNGSYLLEDLTIVQASGGRAVLRSLKARKIERKRVLLVGGVDYGMTGRGTRPTPVKAWQALAGSTEEVKRLSSILAEGGLDPRTLIGKSATKSKMISRLPEANLIHISTHGFFEQAQAEAARRNPLLTNGLVLAGANREGEVESASNGLITAEELICIDLSNADLVTLASCSSGRGESVTGEGIFGLQRALHLAGALTTVASSWNVSDSATKVLMVEFYRNLHERGQGKVESLRNAQLAMLRGKLEFDGKSARAKIVSPYYWAAWSLSGEWQD